MNARSMINAGPGLIRAAGRNGTVLTPYQRAKAFRRTSIARTLLVHDTSEVSDPKVSVTVGQINGITPTIGGTAISATTPPTLSVVTGSVHLHATIDTDGLITALTIENAATRPDDTDVDGYLTLALVTVTSGAIASLQPVAWNLLQMQVCGSVADEGSVTIFLWGGFGE